MSDHTPDVPQKQCSKCKIWLPATAEYFYRHRRKPDGLEPSCKTCRAEYQRNNKERVYENHRRWRDRDREHYRKIHREAKKRNPNNPNTRRRWEESNRDKLRAYASNRRAQRASLPHDFTEEDWRFALSYFGGCCAVCGRPPGLLHTIAADHWIPLISKDCPGSIPSNIVPLCHQVGGCNNSKRSRKPENWLNDEFGNRRAKEVLAKIHEFFSKVRQA